MFVSLCRLDHPRKPVLAILALFSSMLLSRAKAHQNSKFSSFYHFSFVIRNPSLVSSVASLIMYCVHDYKSRTSGACLFSRKLLLLCKCLTTFSLSHFLN